MKKSRPQAHSRSATAILEAPTGRGYRMPAEWEPHAATWLAWPHYHGDWPGKFEPIPWVYTEIIRNLACQERVELIVNDSAAERQVRKLLDKANAPLSSIRFHRWPTNRVWLRDSGCIFVVPAEPGFARPGSLGRLSSQQNSLSRENREGHDFSRADQDAKRRRALAPEGPLRAAKFRFNAWAKYSNWRHDNEIGVEMAAAASVEFVFPYHRGEHIVLEGGSIDVNGLGTLLTTEECLLSKVQQRNPGMTRKDYEKVFAEYLGAPHVIWLGRGIFGDDTHGHVDDLTRFVSPNIVITMVENNSNDVNHKALRDNLLRLKAASDQSGKRLNVIELPMPRPVVFEKRRLPASYANFYIANGIVLVPVFNDANDRIALNTLAEVFPSRQVVPIYAGDLIWGLGTMHCMTQQQPAA